MSQTRNLTPAPSIATAMRRANSTIGVWRLYSNGLGTPRNDEEAEKWARLAAVQGLAPAEFNLGTMYLQGRGVAQDFSEGAAWLQAAAMQGFAAAQHSLATLYASGKGVKRDPAEAVRLHGLAANQGYAPAEADFPTDPDEQAAVTGYSETAIRPSATADRKIEASLTTADGQTSTGIGGAPERPPDSAIDPQGAQTPPPPALPSKDIRPASESPAPAGPAQDVETPGRLESGTSGEADRAPVKIVVRRLEHRDSSGVPTMAIELSPVSNRFSLSSLSVNKGACRVYIRDPAIFSQTRLDDHADRVAKGEKESGKDNNNLSAALSKIILPKIPFDQPMVAEFGQYLRFYADPSVCDVQDVAVVVNDREWKWSSR
jgi:Sel1 repeat